MYIYTTTDHTEEDLKNSIANCKLFMKLVEPLKAFIISKDRKMLTARLIPAIKNIDPRLMVEYDKSFYNYHFEIFLNANIRKISFVYINNIYCTALLDNRRIVAAEWIKAIEKQEAVVKADKAAYEKLLKNYPRMNALRDKYRKALQELADDMKKETAELSEDWRHAIGTQTLITMRDNFPYEWATVKCMRQY